MKIKFLFIFFSFFVMTYVGLTAELNEPFKVVGYYPNWAMYRNPSFYPKDINPKLITHINYAFVKTDEKGNITLFDSWADTDHRTDWNSEKPYWGNFRQLSDLKEKNPALKTLFSVGGWTLSDPFSKMAESPEARANFIRQSIAFAEKYDFDGIDIDWEYPGFSDHSGRPQDKENYTLLLKELYQAAKEHQPPLLVTIAAPAGPSHMKNLELDKIHQYLDWINLMTYDFHGPWGGGEDAVTNHHSALYPAAQGNPDLSIDSAVNGYLSQGVPKNKIVVGMPLYGRSYAKVAGASDGLYSSYNGIGEGSPEAGMHFFKDIKQNLLNNYTRFWDDQAKVPYLYNANTQQFVTYDDEVSLREKAKYIREHQLGGAMVWELGQDTQPAWDGMQAIYDELNP